MSYCISRVCRMAASIAATETQTEQCSKYCTAFRAFRPSGSAGAGDGELKRKLEVDESVRKVMLLNCWTQS
nr:hypothetical protein POPTR_011G042000 [Ipomoea batatas]